MNGSPYSENYATPAAAPVSFPGVRFYWGMIGIMRRGGAIARAGRYDSTAWIRNSCEVGELVEHVGGRIIVEGIENLDFDGPCVLEANHMSTLETMLLPCLVEPRRDTTFVVKQSLLGYPCLGPVLATREPIALGRSNPREDLVRVLSDGQRILGGGRSIIIFTQGTRRKTVEERDFNSLGVKLAKKAGVPVVPVALKTDMWGEGSLIKDIGAITTSLPVHVRFGEAVTLSGSDRADHARITGFIKSSFDEWAAADGTAR